MTIDEWKKSLMYTPSIPFLRSGVQLTLHDSYLKNVILW